MPEPAPSLVLASTSPYRRDLLGRLRIPFECFAPQVEESPEPGESAENLVCRLAKAKAEAARATFPGAVIIGSDQVASLDGQILGKPGEHAAAKAQLRRLSGREVRFSTGVAVVDPVKDRVRTARVDTRVHFRQLDDRVIDRYLRLEQPYDCAGSFRSEGLGIALFSAVHSDDPTALIGLPLIRLVDLLAEAGVRIP